MTRGLQIMQLNTDRRVQCCLSIHPAGEQRPAQTRASAVYPMKTGVLLDRCYILHVSKLVCPLLAGTDATCKTDSAAEVLKRVTREEEKNKRNKGKTSSLSNAGEHNVHRCAVGDVLPTRR